MRKAKRVLTKLLAVANGPSVVSARVPYAGTSELTFASDEALLGLKDVMKAEFAFLHEGTHAWSGSYRGAPKFPKLAGRAECGTTVCLYFQKSDSVPGRVNPPKLILDVAYIQGEHT